MADPAHSARVTLVTGSRPGSACGVGDYTLKLADALAAEGVPAKVADIADWSPRGFLRTLRRLRASPIVHLQHPATAFERKVGPYLLLPALPGVRRILTLHEFSRKGRVGIALSRAMIAAADRIVVTNRTEHDAIATRFPAAAAKLAIIPIGSNIPIAPPTPARTVRIAHFGQIRGGKGIETFLDVVEALGEGPRACLIGSVLPADPAAAALVDRARALGVDLLLDAPAEAVAARLAATRVCLLPFPDGISERRGSALAAMANGALVVATAPVSPEDRALFAPLCLMADGVPALTDRVREALADAYPAEPITAAARVFVAERSWPAIARAHAALYAALVRPQGGPGRSPSQPLSPSRSIAAASSSEP